jgi:hypothetical protein
MALRFLVLTLVLPFLLIGVIGCGGDDGAKPKLSGSKVPPPAEKGKVQQAAQKSE